MRTGTFKINLNTNVQDEGGEVVLGTGPLWTGTRSGEDRENPPTTEAAMTTLIPPTILGPVLTTSPVIRVAGVVAGASVEVRSDGGAVHAEGVAVVNGSAVLEVVRPPVEGELLRASQALGADVSGQSSEGCPVVAPPDEMPRPVFESLLHPCSDRGLLSGLVPGAVVTVRNNGVVLAQVAARTPRQWIAFSSRLGNGDTPTASQALPGGAPGPEGVAEPVSAPENTDLAVPSITPPATACTTVIGITGVEPTARIRLVDADGRTHTWTAVSHHFQARLNAPLPEGEVRLTQEFPACRGLAAEGTGMVGPTAGTAGTVRPPLLPGHTLRPC